MHLHSVIISFNRLELTKQAINSYLETVTLPYSLVVVDNASEESVCEWLLEDSIQGGYDVNFLPINRFPGYATNRGWERMPSQTTLLHRGDNDFSYLPGWCEHVLERFEVDRIGQVGLRTDEEELFNAHNVGGNNVISREIWDDGLRYDERPWGNKKWPIGYTEDSFFSPAVEKYGYTWTRVKQPCIVSLSREDPDDPYYQETWKLRGITPPAKETQ